MEIKRRFFNFLSFKNRRTIHFSLLICLVFIQVLLAGYFYNEFISNQKLSAIEQRLANLNGLENLTNSSKKELMEAQESLQQYFFSRDKKYLSDYFSSLDKIGKNLEAIEKNGKKYPSVSDAISKEKGDKVEVTTFKKIIDSAQKSAENLKPVIQDKSFPKFKKIESRDQNFDQYNVETKKFKDSAVKKKGLFGRLGDAIKGKETVRKDSTVTTIKAGARPNSEKLKKQFDSTVSAVNAYYEKEFGKVKVLMVERQIKSEKNNEFPEIFSNLIAYSNGLMQVYENALNESRQSLENEYNQQNSRTNIIRKKLIISAMVLMFIVSVLIILLTRLAFVFEQKLNLANEKIKENLNFKNRILGMLSHELRSPLKIVDLFIKRINKKVDDPQVKEYLKSISFTNNSLLIQANQILEFTKNQNVVNKLVPKNFNLKDEIDNILSAVAPYIESRHNNFSAITDIPENFMVYSDNIKIHQLYLNILGNANKFTENGTISVTSSANVEGDSVRLLTEISDSGSGISQSDLEKIFEPYYQGVLSGDIENLGAGLGLSLCKEIVELFSGDISVASQKGIGTTVNFEINLKKA